MPDAVQPPHYGGANDPFEVVKIWFGWGFGPEACIANVLKYIRRYAEKDGVQDLKKARRYLDFIINHSEGREIHDNGPALAAESDALYYAAWRELETLAEARARAQSALDAGGVAQMMRAIVERRRKELIKGELHSISEEEPHAQHKNGAAIG